MTRYLICMAVCWASIGSAEAQSSGFYVSGGLGGSESVAETTTAVAPGSAYFTTTDPGQIAGSGTGKLSQGQLSGGIAAGYDKLFGRILVGIETSANTLSFDDSRSSGQVYISQPTASFVLTQSVKADWMVALRGKLGWAQDRWLTYVTGGLAMTQVKLNTGFSDNYSSGGFTAAGQDSSSKSRTGWTVGLGGEYVLNRNWSLRGDYLYAKFDSIESSMTVTHQGFPGQTSVVNTSVDLKTQIALIGLTYHFD